MGKDSDQPSGVVGGTMDISVQGEQDIAQPTDAGVVLAHRRQAASRAKKLEALHENEKKTAPGRGKR